MATLLATIAEAGVLGMGRAATGLIGVAAVDGVTCPAAFTPGDAHASGLLP